MSAIRRATPSAQQALALDVETGRVTIARAAPSRVTSKPRILALRAGTRARRYRRPPDLQQLADSMFEASGRRDRRHAQFPDS